MPVAPRAGYSLGLPGGATLSLGGRTLVMGVVNVTPDSFSDGGDFLDAGAALAQARRLIAEGADLLDIGGETTRPGSDPTPEDIELSRVIPLISAIRRESGIPVSVDTTKSGVARAALAAGASMVNDIAALRFDPALAGVCAEAGAPLVLMHMRGTPRDMQHSPVYDSLFSEVIAFLEERVKFAVSLGVPRGQIVVDPGIGFGKTLAHNLALVRGLERLSALDRPVLLGVSRKRFIGAVLGRPEPKDRELGTAVANTFGIMAGAHIIRVHDVAFQREAARMADALRGDTPS